MWGLKWLILNFLGHVPRTMRMVSLGLPPYNVFTLEEMEDATNNFDAANLVAEGTQGQVIEIYFKTYFTHEPLLDAFMLYY